MPFPVDTANAGLGSYRSREFRNLLIEAIRRHGSD